MAFAYQQLSNYSGNLYGEPRQQGIEYDWEVPINQVVSSPGGVSDIQHHWTGGMYGRGNTSSDIYAGQGYRYPSAEFGNLYKGGHEAGQAYPNIYPEAPDYQYWKNEEPQQYSYSKSQASLKGANLLDVPNTEKFTKVDLSDTDTSYQSPIESPNKRKWMLLVIMIMTFIVASFWADSIKSFISQVGHGGKRFNNMRWNYILIYSVLATGLFILGYWALFD